MQDEPRRCQDKVEQPAGRAHLCFTLFRTKTPTSNERSAAATTATCADSATFGLQHFPSQLMSVLAASSPMAQRTISASGPQPGGRGFPPSGGQSMGGPGMGAQPGMGGQRETCRLFSASSSLSLRPSWPSWTSRKWSCASPLEPFSGWTIAIAVS